MSITSSISRDDKQTEMVDKPCTEIEKIIALAIYEGLISRECDAEEQEFTEGSHSYVMGKPYFDPNTMIDGRFYIDRIARRVMAQLRSEGYLDSL